MSGSFYVTRTFHPEASAMNKGSPHPWVTGRNTTQGMQGTTGLHALRRSACKQGFVASSSLGPAEAVEFLNRELGVLEDALEDLGMEDSATVIRQGHTQAGLIAIDAMASALSRQAEPCFLQSLCRFCRRNPGQARAHKQSRQPLW